MAMMFELMDLSFEREKKLEFGGYVKRYDFYLPEFNLLVEFDGEYWHKNSIKECETDIQKMNFRNDLLKNKIAKELGYKLVRVRGYSNITKVWEII